MKYWFFYRWLC